MAEYWAAALAVVGTGIQAYSASQAGGSAFAGVPPVKFNPIDVSSTVQQGIDADTAGYNLSDKDFAARFPGLVSTRTSQINDAAKQINSPLDPTVQNAFTKQGVTQALGSTGGGNALAGLGGTGSAAQKTTAQVLGNDVLNKQDADRGYLDTLIAANPQRSFGPTGAGAAQLEIQNAQNTNQYNLSNYAYQLQKQSADNAGGGF